MIAYIIAGAILGILSPLILSPIFSYRTMTVSTNVTYMLAFVGGVAGHFFFNLVYN